MYLDHVRGRGSGQRPDRRGDAVGLDRAPRLQDLVQAGFARLRQDANSGRSARFGHRDPLEDPHVVMGVRTSRPPGPDDSSSGCATTGDTHRTPSGGPCPVPARPPRPEDEQPRSSRRTALRAARLEHLRHRAPGQGVAVRYAAEAEAVVVHRKPERLADLRSTVQEATTMKRIQMSRRPRTPREPAPPDLRTPSGRPLPY